MFVPLVFAAALNAAAFSYDATAPLRAHYGASVKRDGVAVTDVSFMSTTGHTVRGVVVRGLGKALHPGVLFVHWLGDDVPTTNHTEFESDAVALAKRGVTALLIDAMWAQPHWYEKVRTFDTDYANSIGQVIDLRRSLDELLRQPNVDTSRIAYVGHDFGSMYGAVLAGVDPRPQWFVLMAGTTTFSEWYLLDKKPADISAYVASMEPLDPLPFLSRATAHGFFFQFAAHDVYITPEHEFAFYSAAPLPRTMSVYNIDHSMRTPAAVSDRLAWLAEKLQL